MTHTSVLATFAESTGVLLSIVTPLIAVPLTALTFYLRSLREQQCSAQTLIDRRVASIEESVTEVRRSIKEFDRDYTNKEEWLRECMLARRNIEVLRETSVRLETTMDAVVGDRSILRSHSRPGCDLSALTPAVAAESIHQQESGA